MCEMIYTVSANIGKCLFQLSILLINHSRASWPKAMIYDFSQFWGQEFQQGFSATAGVTHLAAFSW